MIRYLLTHDCDQTPTYFTGDTAGRLAAIATAERHLGAELNVNRDGQVVKARCRRVEVWLVKGPDGERAELVLARQDGVLQDGRAPVRGRLSPLAARTITPLSDCLAATAPLPS